MAAGERRGVRGVPLTERAVAGVVVAGVRAAAAAAKEDALPGVAVGRDDRFVGLGEDTALVNDSKKLDMVLRCCVCGRRRFQRRLWPWPWLVTAEVWFRVG